MLTYTVELHPQKEGGYTVIVPALPGCISEGDTLAVALTNIQEAIEGYLLTLADRRRTVPVEIPHRRRVRVPLAHKHKLARSTLAVCA